MTYDAVFLFPGQGSQSVGMGRSFWERSTEVRRLFEEASELLGVDLRKLCFDGPDATLVRTDNVQPAITLVNIAALQVLREEGIEPAATAGHSLGEYAALHAAGVLSFADTMRLVRFRGAVMQQAADRHPGGMTAVFGLDVDALGAICREVADTGSVEVANHNSPTQVVLTGDKEALQRAATLARTRGAKLTVPLKVSGPWHSRYMREASERMRERLGECVPSAPAVPVMSNVTAEQHQDDPAAIRAALVAQMVSPVAWCRSVQRLVEEGHGLFVEVGPGKVLTGLMRDIDRNARAFSVQDAASLAGFLASRAGALAS